MSQSQCKNDVNSLGLTEHKAAAARAALLRQAIIRRAFVFGHHFNVKVAYATHDTL